MHVHPHEEALVRAFIAHARRNRWLESLASPKRRTSFLDRLNHCHDFDERYATALASNANVVGLLKARGAPPACYVISCTSAIDARELPLADAVEQSAMGGWGTLISCLPGRLAYYYGEEGEVRLLLQRPPR